MGRHKTSLAMNVEAFDRLVLSRATLEEVGKSYGVSKQAVYVWCKNGRIPPRAIANIALKFDLSPEEVKEILSPPRDPDYDWEKKYRALKLKVIRLARSLELGDADA